jgi:hypothetical protein
LYVLNQLKNPVLETGKNRCLNESAGRRHSTGFVLQCRWENLNFNFKMGMGLKIIVSVRRELFLLKSNLA